LRSPSPRWAGRSLRRRLVTTRCSSFLPVAEVERTGSRRSACSRRCGAEPRADHRPELALSRSCTRATAGRRRCRARGRHKAGTDPSGRLAPDGDELGRRDNARDTTGCRAAKQTSGQVTERDGQRTGRIPECPAGSRRRVPRPARVAVAHDLADVKPNLSTCSVEQTRDVPEPPRHRAPAALGDVFASERSGDHERPPARSAANAG